MERRVCLKTITPAGEAESSSSGSRERQCKGPDHTEVARKESTKHWRYKQKTTKKMEKHFVRLPLLLKMPIPPKEI